MAKDDIRRWLEDFRAVSFLEPEGWIESMTPPPSKGEEIKKEILNKQGIPGATRTHIPVPFRCEHCEVDWHTSEECPKRPDLSNDFEPPRFTP